VKVRRHLAFTVLICLFCAAMALSDADGEADAAAWAAVQERLRNAIPDEASLKKLTSEEDSSPRFQVKRLRVRGNRLISSAHLLEDLPLIYVTSEEKDGARVEEIYDFRALRDILVEPGTDRDVSLQTIQGLTKHILSVYKEEGYAGIYVYVPADAVGDASQFVDHVLPIQVLEGTVAKLTIGRYDADRQEREEGYLKEAVIESWSPVRVGEAIRKNKLDHFLNLLNLNPDRHVSAVVSRSAEPNALHVTYDVYEANPWHWYLQADNAGTEDRQWAPRAGLIHTNLTGTDDRLSLMYQAPWKKGIEDEYAVFGSYDRPVLTPRLRLNVYAGHSEFDVPGLSGVDFLGNGSFCGGTLSYNLFHIRRWFVDLVGSLSHERSKVTPSLGIGSDVDMDLWGVGVNVHRSDQTSSTSLAFRRTESMGGSSWAEFQNARLNSEPDFHIYHASAAHQRFLDLDKVSRIRCSLQYVAPDERLVPAKMTTFGGMHSVRGYEEAEIVADGGLMLSGQYEYDLVQRFQGEADPEVTAPEKGRSRWELTKFAPLVFLDCGRAKTKDPIPGEQGTRELCSVGTGVIVEVGDRLTASLYYGWALRGTEETERGDNRLSASLVYRF